MRRLLLSLGLTCLAVLALLNPIAVVTAQAACLQSVSAAMGGMEAMPGAKAGIDRAHGRAPAPCCDPTTRDKSSKGCAQACALSFPMVVAPQTTALTVSLVTMPVTVFLPPDTFGFAHPLSGRHRPPKFIA